MRLLVITALVLCSLTCAAQQNRICISIDDLPVVNHGIKDSTFQQGIFYKILASFKKNHVPAIGFVNERKLYDDEHLLHYQVEFLKNWIGSGLELGNHTFSHRDFNDVSLKQYISNIEKGETFSKALLNQQHKQLTYFRHPYLHVGNTKAKADSLDEYLRKRKYTVASVTIDNEDYVFALAYTRAKQKNDSALMRRIGGDYVAYMEKKIIYYEKQSNYLFGRNIYQILLIHASLLNSDYLDSLLQMLRTHQYQFISMDEALTDKAYQTKVTVFGRWGISWIDRWAMSMGKKELFKEDPATPDYIKKLAE